MICFSFGSHALSVSSIGGEQALQRHADGVNAAVEAPGEAPRSATNEWSSGADKFGSEFQQTAAC